MFESRGHAAAWAFVAAITSGACVAPEEGAVDAPAPVVLEEVAPGDRPARWAWEQTAEVPGEAPAVGVFAVDGALWALTNDGRERTLRRRGVGGWEEAGALPPGGAWGATTAALVGDDEGGLWLSGQDGALWRSRDGARSWAREDASPEREGEGRVERIWRAHGDLFMLESDGRASDQVRLWRRGDQGWSFVHDKGFMIIDYVPLPDVLLHSMRYGWVSASRDGGASWAPYADGPVGVGRAPRLFRVAGGVVAVGDDGIWWTDEGARSWDRLEAFRAGAATALGDTVYVHDVAGEAIVALDVASSGAPSPMRYVTWAPTSRIESLAVGDDGLLATGADRSVWFAPTSDGLASWTRERFDPPRVAQLAWDGEDVWARMASGAVRRLEGGEWSEPVMVGAHVISGYEGGLIGVGLDVRRFVGGAEQGRTPLTAPPDASSAWLPARGALLWAAPGRDLLRLDAREGGEWRVIEEAPSGWIAADTGGARVGAFDGAVLWLSEDRGASWSRAVSVPALRCDGEGAPLLAVDAEAAWMWRASACDAGGLWRLDARTGALTLAEVPWAAEARPTALAARGGTLHVATTEGLWRLDAQGAARLADAPAAFTGLTWLGEVLYGLPGRGAPFALREVR